MPKKKPHFILFFASIFASLFFLSGCVEEVFVDELKRPESSVRFIQADSSYETTTFRIYGRFEDTSKVVAEATVDYGSASSYLTIPSGVRKLEIISSLGTVTTTLTFTSYWQTSLTLRAGALSSLYERLTYSDEAYNIDGGAGTKGAIRFRNLMNSAIYPALDDKWFPNPASSTSFAAGSISAYITLETGNYYFWFTATEADTVGVDLNVAGNVRYTIAAFGTPANPELKIFKDDGK
jgi:hypothetical protein